MPVRTNIQGLLLTAAPIGVLMLIFALQGFGLTQPPSWSPDLIIWTWGKAAGCYLLAFGALHFVLSSANIGGREAYAGTGALAGLFSFAAMVEADSIAQMSQDGYLIAALLIPLSIGAGTGFLYHGTAGYSAEGDEPDLLQNLINGTDAVKQAPSSANLNEGQVSQDGALADTGKAQYFNGPLQVRTSFGTMILAAFIATFLYNLGAMFMWILSILAGGGLRPSSPTSSGPVTPSLPSQELPPTFPTISSKITPEDVARQSPETSGLSDLFGSAGRVPDIASAPTPIPELGFDQFFTILANFASSGLIIAIAMAVPFAIILFALHMLARSIGTNSYLGYGLIGFFGPPVIGMLLFVLFAFLGMKMAFPSAIAMMFYRKFAGLEPQSIAEDIEVSDGRTLVGANHARRTFGRVVMR